MWMHVCTFLNWIVISHDRSLCCSIFSMSRVERVMLQITECLKIVFAVYSLGLLKVYYWSKVFLLFSK